VKKMARKKSDKRKRKKEFSTIVKRNLNKIEKLLQTHFYKLTEKVKNENGTTNRFVRDAFLESLANFFTENGSEIMYPITSKVDYKIRKISATFYKENENFIDAFVVIKFKISAKEEIIVGIVVALIVRDTFVTFMNKNNLDEIIKDEKRPRRFYHSASVRIL